MFASFDYGGNLELFISVCVGVLIMTFFYWSQLKQTQAHGEEQEPRSVLSTAGLIGNHLFIVFIIISGLWLLLLLLVVV